METIKIKGPYNFDLVLDRLSLDPLNVIDEKKRLLKLPMIVDQIPMVAVVRAIGTTEEPEFTIEGINETYRKDVIVKVTHILQWNTPLIEIQQFFLQTDLRQLFIEHKGTPLVLDYDPYNCLIKCIIHQQLNLSFAHTLTERFVKTYGFELDGVFFYPPPEKVANLSVDQLRKLQFSGRKAEYIIGLAREITTGNLDLEEIKCKSEEEVTKHLIKLKGIGPWTVQNFLMFALGRPNLFPVADIGLQNALKNLYMLEEKPSKEQIEGLINNWSPYLSYAALYLWRSIEKN